MERIFNYEIPIAYEGKKISDFLKSMRYSEQILKELRKNTAGETKANPIAGTTVNPASGTPSITLNGNPVYMNHTVTTGDSLQVIIRETHSSKKIPPVDLPFPIVYEDEDLIVVNKPANMPIHPSLNNYENTLGNAAAFYFAKKGEPFIYRCINRLDRDTSGLTIIARHALSSSILYEDMSNRSIHREYTAIVLDDDKLPASGTIDLPIGRNMDSTIERRIDHENGERAITHFQVADRRNGLALVKFQLETGRTHQIRVHMKALGYPLLGDFLYNPGDTHMKRQALHAGKLAFTHPITREALCFEVPMPQDMQELFYS